MAYRLAQAFFTSLLLVVGSVQAQVITVDTSIFAGSSAQLAFDFIDGGSPENMVTVSGFISDGQLRAASFSGSVSGSLPTRVLLADTSFFNEYLLDVTLGKAFSFRLDATAIGPDATSFPDAFSLLVLNSSTGLSLLHTADPTGADALLTFAIDGSQSGAMNLYSETVSVSAVPEPQTIWLSLMGLGLLALKLKTTDRRKK